MMHNTSDMLNEIIAVARDGQTFYTEAATKVEDPQLRTSFREIATIKGRMVTELSAAVSRDGEKPATHGTWVGDLNKFYAKVRGMFGDRDYAYVAQLEESEDRLKARLDQALAETSTPQTVRDTLTRLLPQVRQCHDLMRERKLTMKRAA